MIRANETKYCHLALIAIFILPACFGGCAGASSGGVESTGFTIYVNAVNGDDILNNGRTAEQPYRTITKALSAPYTNYTVSVAAGTYDAVLGEQFPIYLKPGVQVQGDNDNKGNGAQAVAINGSGSYLSSSLSATFLVAIVCDHDTMISGFKIAAPNGVGIWCEENSADVVPISNTTIITKCTLTGSDNGIIVAGTASPMITNNVISLNNISGIGTIAQSAPIIADNNLQNNAIGIAISNTSQPNIGTDSAPGFNTISQNTLCDLNNATNNQILAIGNIWDDDPFLFTETSACSNGSNIANTGLGFVRCQSIPSSNESLFSPSNIITVSQPINGALLTSNTPQFTWTPTHKKYVMLGLFSQQITIQGNSINNTDKVIWVWYSGLGGGEGDISYLNGVSIINGDFNQQVSPIPLQKGKSYYYAVWAWDDQAKTITDSSVQQYFTITNY